MLIGQKLNIFSSEYDAAQFISKNRAPRHHPENSEYQFKLIGMEKMAFY